MTDRETHARRVCDPDGYRPERCPRCLHPTLHLHDHLERVQRADPHGSVISIVRYQCAHPDCGATWRVLPAFVARHLWHPWDRITEQVVTADAPDATQSAPRPRAAAIPPRTRERWKSRLCCAARLLLVTFLAAMVPHGVVLATDVGLDGTREQLVSAYRTVHALPADRSLWVLAAHLHRLEPGLRLM